MSKQAAQNGLLKTSSRKRIFGVSSYIVTPKIRVIFYKEKRLRQMILLTLQIYDRSRLKVITSKACWRLNSFLYCAPLVSTIGYHSQYNRCYDILYRYHLWQRINNSSDYCFEYRSVYDWNETMNIYLKNKRGQGKAIDVFLRGVIVNGKLLLNRTYIKAKC